MGKTFRQELYQLRCRWRSWILLCMALLGCFLIENSTPIGTYWDDVKIDAQCIQLMTKAAAESHVVYYTNSPKTRHDKELVGLGEVYGLPAGSVKNAEDIYAALTEAEYTRVMWFGGGLFCLCIILPTVLIRYSLNTGVPDWSAKFCGSRRRVARAKVLLCNLLILLFSLAYTLLLVYIYARYIVSRQGIGFFLGTLAAHTLMELAVLSVPLYIAFRCRNPYSVLGFNTAYGVLCYAVNVAAHYQDGVLFIPFPAWLHGLRKIWQPGTSALWLGLASLISLVYILLFGWLSVRRFERTGPSFGDHSSALQRERRT